MDQTMRFNGSGWTGEGWKRRGQISVFLIKCILSSLYLNIFIFSPAFTGTFTVPWLTIGVDNRRSPPATKVWNWNFTFWRHVSGSEVEEWAHLMLSDGSEGRRFLVNPLLIGSNKLIVTHRTRSSEHKTLYFIILGGRRSLCLRCYHDHCRRRYWSLYYPIGWILLGFRILITLRLMHNIFFITSLNSLSTLVGVCAACSHTQAVDRNSQRKR